MSDKSLLAPKVLRSDIQALRALAIATVVIFHLWPFRLPGGFVGVDVFFVISGFLITTHLIREVERDSFKISHFWVRRIRRLLPASFTVLTATGMAVVLLVPVQLWLQWLKEIQASILYFENWILALDAVDYLALSNEASPAQHFWSLSVEEQFYIVWPLLIAVALLFVRKRSLKVRRISILVILLLITLSSLAYGLYMTQAEPAIAYFSTPVRAWEFGVGALAAFIPSISKTLWSAITSIIGLVLIAVSSILFTTALPFPGYWALIPVLGAAAVILGASNTGVLGRFFEFKPFQWLGERSYSIYLWHWPIIILLPYALNSELTTETKLAALALTLLLASITTAKIEKPFLAGGKVRQFKPVTVFGALLVISSLLVGSLQFGITQANAIIAAEKKKTDDIVNGSLDCFGAGARAPGQDPCTDPDLTELYPSLDSAAADNYWPEECVVTNREDVEPIACEVGKSTSDTKIALVGDSHTKHYVAAFVDLAKKNNWSVEVYVKGGCPFSIAERLREDTVLTEACSAYVQNMEQIILNKNFDLVVTSQKNGVEWITANGKSQEETAIEGLERAWSNIVSNGTPVLAIKDSPMPIPKVIRCLEINSQEECSAKRSESLLFDPQIEAVNRFDSELVSLVEFDDVFCDDSVCFPVIGNVVVYRDANHLTSTFTRTLARFIKPYIQSALNK
jgi:peptidoglycan/LPS O-acetylase OafA/YrhL